MTLWGMVARPDGTEMVRVVGSMSIEEDDPRHFGDAMGQKILALGANTILAELGLLEDEK